MSIEFKVPELGEGVESADVVGILVSEGDTIEADQTVMELETDKAITDLPCPYAGKILEIHVSEGDTIKIGQTLLTIEETPSETKAKADEGDKEESSEEAEKEPEEEQSPEEPKEEPPKEEKSETKKEHEEKVKVPEEDGAFSSVPAGPATRRLARKLGVDLRQVQGSGASSRVVLEDVVQAHERTSPSVPKGASVFAADFEKFGPIERRSLNKIAQTALKRLSYSWSTIPLVTQHDLADITELENTRRQYIQEEGQDGPKITLTAIMAKAIIAVLKEFPQFNASLNSDKNELILKKYYHIGIAVDTEEGLLVPVLRDVDRKSILELAAELEVLAQKARDHKLTKEEMEGASFTISNQGGIGGIAFTPIVNFPEVAILGISCIRTEVRFIDEKPEPRLMLPLSLSYDHRVINGADAARFLVRLSAELSDSFQLLIRT